MSDPSPWAAHWISWRSIPPAFGDIWVDGKLKRKSAAVKLSQEPQVVVVRYLEKAQSLKLVTRAAKANHRIGCLTWMEPRFRK